MSGAAFGRLDGDLIGRSFSILGKLVIDEHCNLIAANATVQHATIQDTLFVGKIYEEEALYGITITGNVMIDPGYAIISPLVSTNIAQIDYLLERTTNNGIIVQSNVCVQDGKIIKASHITKNVTGNGLVLSYPVMKQRFGLGKVHLSGVHTVDSVSGSQIEFTEKTFENSLNGVIHPEGNTLVTFIAPSVNQMGFEYGNAYVRVTTNLGVYFSNGEGGDKVRFKIMKDKSTVVSEYVHTLSGPCIDADETFSWTDLVAVAPGQILDIYARGNDFSGNLSANILGGQAISSVSFEIESFDL